jgi:adenylate/nucleoside-diphosphate kinase
MLNFALLNVINVHRQPWQYVGQTLPRKLPPPAVSIDIKSLPIMGYLEQNVAISVQKALVAVGHARPKLADRDISESAVRYLALYFKGICK